LANTLKFYALVFKNSKPKHSEILTGYNVGNFRVRDCSG